MAVRGCWETGSPFGDFWTGSSNSGSSKTFTPGFSTYFDDALIVAGLTSMTDGNTGAGFSSWSNASVSNIVEQIDQYSDVGNGGGLGVVTASKATAGSLGSFSVTDAYPTSGVGSASFVFSLVPKDVKKPFIRNKGASVTSISQIVADNNWYLGNVVSTDDLVCVFVETDNEDVSITGYTNFANSPVNNTNSNATRLYAYYKRAGSSETAPTIPDSGQHQVAANITVGGAITSGDPVDVSATNTGSGTSVSITGATTSADNRLVLLAATNGASTSNVGGVFSSWANANLSSLTELHDASMSSGNSGGALAVASGYKSTTGSYGTTTVTGANYQWATWSAAIKPQVVNTTLSAVEGTLSLTGQDAYFGRLFAEDSALSVSGGDAQFNTGYSVTCAAGAIAQTGLNAALVLGYGMAADFGVLSISSAASTFGQKMQAGALAMTLAESSFEVLAPESETFTLGLVVDLYPSSLSNVYRRYSPRLRIDGTEVPVRSWSWDESDQSLAGTLQIELADVSDRSGITKDSTLEFDLGTWNGTSFDWTPLIDTGKLSRTDYSLSRSGIGPADTFTFTGYSEMDDRLNAVPTNNLVLYDPATHTVSAGDIEGIYDSEGNYYAPTVVATNGQTLHGILQHIFVNECGFASVSTNIPNFPVPLAEFGVGQPYVSTIGGIIGMFEPVFTATDSAGLNLVITDGTSTVVPGMPSPRRITTTKALSMGVASDLTRVKALTISVNQQRYTFDYWTDRVEITNDTQGATEPFPAEFFDVQKTTVYRDFYRNSNPDRPVKTEIKSQATSTYRNGTELVAESTENFKYDSWGRLNVRVKNVTAKVPDPDNGFSLSLIPVSEEIENNTWKMHPYKTGVYYRSKREVAKAGLVLVDGDNQQLGKDYVRDAVTVYRAGNVTEGMTSDWQKISTVIEEVEPQRNQRVKVKRTETDHLQALTTFEDEDSRDGDVGSNIFVSEQQRIMIFPDGETSVTGAVQSVNMGELPLTMAVALARRILKQRTDAPERVSFTIPGADLTLQKGVPFNARGRADEDLGNYIIEGRRIIGDANGVTMSVQARSAT